MQFQPQYSESGDLAFLSAYIDAIDTDKGSNDSFPVAILNTGNLTSSSYNIVVQSAVIPNQVQNIRKGVNDTLIVVYTTVVPGTTNLGAQGTYIITIPPGNYTPVTIASTLTGLLQSTVNTEWNVGATWTVTWDATKYGLQPYLDNYNGGIPNGYALFTTLPSKEQSFGVPMYYPSERTIETLGLQMFWDNHQGSNFPPMSNPQRMNYLVQTAYNYSPPQLTGTDYVDLLASFGNSVAYHSKPAMISTVARIPMDGIAETTTYTRTTSEYQIAAVNANLLSSFQLSLIDRWGNPFTLPSSSYPSFEIRLYPVS